MRKWLALAGLLIVAVAGLVALAVANLDRWLNANRELVAEQVEKALGREVSFGEVGVSFAGGLGVRVTELRVGDDPDFADDDFLRSQAVDVRVRIWPALFGNIEIDRVILRGPQVTVIRTADGLSTDSLGGTEGSSDPAEETGGASPERALLVALVDIRDGRIRYVDRSEQPPAEFELAALDVRASDIRPGQPVVFQLEAALLGSEKQNLEISGSVGPLGDAAPGIDLSVSLSPVSAEKALALPPLREALPPDLRASGPLELELKVEGSAESLHFDASLDAEGAALSLGESFDKARGVPMRVALAGTRSGDSIELEKIDLRLDAAEVQGSAKLTSVENTRGVFALSSPRLPLDSFGAGGAGEELRDVTLEGKLEGPKTSAQLRSAAGNLRGDEYRNLEADVSMSGGRIDIQKAAFEAWGGAASTSGSYDTSAAKPRFDLRTKVERVRVEQLLADRSPGLARVLSGELSTQLGARGAGSSWEEIRPLLDGSGDLRLADGLLRQFNAAGDALRAFSALPQLSGSGLARFVSAHPQVFGAEDTRIDELSTKLRIREGWVALPGFLLGSNEYELRGGRRGRVSLTGDFDLPLDVVLSSLLSSDAVAAAKQLRYLQQPDGRVALPLLLRGSPPVPTLDPESVSRLALQVGSGLLVERLLGGTLGGTPEAPPPDGAAEAEPPPPTEPAPITQDDLIREGIQRGLEGLLGGQKR